MTVRWQNLLKPLVLGLGLAVLALLGLLWSGAPPAARAAGPTCTVCLDGGCDYTDIQAAVDDAGCTEIKVAQGVYTGVQARPVPAGYLYPPASGLIAQVVYISRTVALQGGYTTTNWTTPDPLTQPTTLDAGGLGRALMVAGDISPTIEGLSLTNGNAAGLGGSPWGGGQENCGGGAYVLSATAAIRACRVFGNTADDGGGLFLDSSSAAFISNSVTANTAFDGGGPYLYYSPATLSANSITTNTAYNGGGLFLWYSPATLSANSIVANSAITNHGGGLFLERSNATLSANSVTSNTAWYGGGLFLDYGTTTLSADSVTSNSATYGGGLVVGFGDPTLTNTVVADNWAGNVGSGLCIDKATPRLLHTTIARNDGGDGSGLYVEAGGGTSTVWLTNTILVSQAVGIAVTAGSTATLNGTLWYSNTTNWSGAGAINHSGDYTGTPAFVDPDGGDYHIGPGSAAINRGVAAGVATDKDGHPRDAHPDLGAYEFQGPVTYTYLPVILKASH